MARSSKGISLSQGKYVLKTLEESGFLGAKPAKFPMDQNLARTQTNGELLSDPSSYGRLVGRLIYIMITILDLVYHVHILSQFIDKPRASHLEAAHGVLRYLKRTLGQGILLSATRTIQLRAFCDALGSSQRYKTIGNKLLNTAWAITCFLEDKEANYSSTFNG